MPASNKERLAKLQTMLKMFDVGDCYAVTVTRTGKIPQKPFVLRTRNYRGRKYRVNRWSDYTPTTLKTQFQTIEALEARAYEIINAYQHWVNVVDEKSRHGMK